MATLQGGDIIAFYGPRVPLRPGNGNIGSGASHIAMVLDPTVQVDYSSQDTTMLLESTTDNQGGRSGPQITYLSMRSTNYQASYHLPLADNIRAFLNFSVLFDVACRKLYGDTCYVQELQEYTLRGLPFKSYIPKVQRAGLHEGRCAEFLAELFRAGGIPGIDPSQMTADKLISFRMYGEAEQLTGEPAELFRYNVV